MMSGSDATHSAMRAMGASATGVRPALGPANGDVHVGERLGAGVGEHQPRRRRRLGRRQALGELQPVDCNLFSGNHAHGTRAGLRSRAVAMIQDEGGGRISC